MSRAMSNTTGMVRNARKMPPTPNVSAMVWRGANAREISKSMTVAGLYPPTCIVWMTKSAPLGASSRSVVALMCRSFWPSVKPGAVDVEQVHFAVRQFGIGQHIAEDVLREYRRSGTVRQILALVVPSVQHDHFGQMARGFRVDAFHQGDVFAHDLKGR